MLRNASIITSPRHPPHHPATRTPRSKPHPHPNTSPTPLRTRHHLPTSNSPNSRRLANINMIGKVSKRKLALYDERVKRITDRAGNPM